MGKGPAKLQKQVCSSKSKSESIEPVDGKRDPQTPDEPGRATLEIAHASVKFEATLAINHHPYALIHSLLEHLPVSEPFMGGKERHPNSSRIFTEGDENSHDCLLSARQKACLDLLSGDIHSSPAFDM